MPRGVLIDRLTDDGVDGAGGSVDRRIYSIILRQKAGAGANEYGIGDTV